MRFLHPESSRPGWPASGNLELGDCGERSPPPAWRRRRSGQYVQVNEVGTGSGASAGCSAPTANHTQGLIELAEHEQRHAGHVVGVHGEVVPVVVVEGDCFEPVAHRVVVLGRIPVAASQALARRKRELSVLLGRARSRTCSGHANVSVRNEFRAMRCVSRRSARAASTDLRASAQSNAAARLVISMSTHRYASSSFGRVAARTRCRIWSAKKPAWTVAGVVTGAGGGEGFLGELADRLQHPVPHVAVARSTCSNDLRTSESKMSRMSNSSRSR